MLLLMAHFPNYKEIFKSRSHPQNNETKKRLVVQDRQSGSGDSVTVDAVGCFPINKQTRSLQLIFEL